MTKTSIGRPLRRDHIFGPEMYDDPYRVYREFRESTPVFRDESLKAWVLTRYDDVAFVLNDQRFSSNRIGAAQSQLNSEPYRPLLEVMSDKMSEKDEPDHKRLRSLVHQAFVRVAVEKWEPLLQSRIDQLLEGLLTTRGCEFIGDFAVPLPLITIMSLVGVPAEDRDQVKAWCDDFAFVALNFYTHMSEQQIRSGLTSINEFRAYLEKRIAVLRGTPEDNLLSALLQAEHEDHRLTMDELLANTFLLLSAGNETTTCLLGNGLAALLRYPEQMQRLRDDPSMIPTAVEEFLRFDSPVQFLGRLATEDVEIGSTRIPKGDLVLAMLAAANRDPARFENPDGLDVGREENHHLAFGHGRHFCVGSQLARLEARLAFQTLLERTTNIELDGLELKDLRHHDNFNIRCLETLPLRLEPA